MTVWIVLLLLLAVLSPLTWLIPSRRQKGSMEVRLQARRLGLSMQLAEQHWPHWQQPEPPQRCGQYYVPRRRSSVDIWSYWQASPGVWVNQWREPCSDARVAARLAELPADAFKVDAGAQLLSVYWGERGGEGALEKVHAVLKALA